MIFESLVLSFKGWGGVILLLTLTFFVLLYVWLNFPPIINEDENL